MQPIKLLTCGFINVDKPAGMTSHDVVSKLRQWTKIKRIGHAGTLDPDATGVLPVAIGPATRLISYLSNNKVYLSEILLGTSTTTDDLSGQIVEQQELSPAITVMQIETVLSNYTGQIQQKPPIYSAVHKNGQRLYEIARAKFESKTSSHSNSQFTTTIDNVLAEIDNRSVQITKLELLQVNLPVIKLRIFCSAGTYIRSLARDIGQSLGCGACIKSLHREISGVFRIEAATPLERIESEVKTGKFQNLLLPPQAVLPSNFVNLDLLSAISLVHGKSIPIEMNTYKNLHRDLQHCLAIYSPNMQTHNPITLALCSLTKTVLLKPEVVLVSPEDLKPFI